MTTWPIKRFEMCARDRSFDACGARAAGRTVIWPTNAPSDSAKTQHMSGSASASRRCFISAANDSADQPGGANEEYSSRPSMTPHTSSSASAMVARQMRIESSRVTSMKSLAEQPPRETGPALVAAATTPGTSRRDGRFDRRAVVDEASAKATPRAVASGLCRMSSSSGRGHRGSKLAAALVAVDASAVWRASRRAVAGTRDRRQRPRDGLRGALLGCATGFEVEVRVLAAPEAGELDPSLNGVYQHGRSDNARPELVAAPPPCAVAIARTSVKASRSPAHRV